MSSEQAGAGLAPVIGGSTMGQKILGRRPSILLLIVIKPAAAKRRIVIPIPVALVTVLVETAGFWGSILGRLGVRLPQNVAQASLKGSKRLPYLPLDLNGESLNSILSAVFGALEGLWLDLISYGSWSLVDIKSSDGDRVLIRFI